MTTRQASAASVELPQVEGWLLTPEGAVVHRDERVAVIADPHLGHEWAKGSGGDCVPAHTLAETTAKLERLLSRAPIDRLIVAGDVVESGRPCSRTAADLDRLLRWLVERGIQLVLVTGNHDRSLGWMFSLARDRAPYQHCTLTHQWEVAGWTVIHGHQPSQSPRVISGHLHPVLRFAGQSFPCILASATQIILPAFSENAAGLDVATTLVPVPRRDTPFRCFVGADVQMVDFGPLSTLRDRMSSSASTDARTRSTKDGACGQTACVKDL